MKLKFSVIFLLTVLIFGYQNCADEINIEELKLSSLCYREPDAVGCSGGIHDNNDILDNDSGSNDDNSNSSDDNSQDNNNDDNTDDEDKGSAPFTHSIFGPSSALEDSELVYYIQNNGDERSVAIEWSYRCPGDQDNLKNIGSSASCQNGISCIRISCDEEGDISNQALVQANIKYKGFIVKTLTKATTITEANKTVLNPSIVAPGSAQLINQEFNLSLSWPSNKPADLNDGASYSWSIPSGCSITGGNKYSSGTIKAKCSNLATHQFGFSYTSDDYRGSANANVQVIGSLEITKNFSSIRVGEEKSVTVSHSNLANPQYDWSSSFDGCSGSSKKSGDKYTHKIKCSRRPSKDDEKVKFTLKLKSGGVTLQDDFSIGVTKGNLSLSLSVPTKAHLLGEKASASVSSSPEPSQINYKWEVSDSGNCKIYGSGKSVKVSCNSGNGGEKNLKVTVYNHNYTSSTTKKVKFVSSNAITLANCSWMSSSLYNNAPGYVPSTYHSILDYKAPTNKVLVGISSYFNDSKDDRRWNFKYCEIKIGNNKLNVSTPVRQSIYNTQSNYYMDKQNILEDGECDLDEVMTGKYGLYGQKTDDRGYALYCSKPSYGSYKTKLTSCEEPTSKQVYDAGRGGRYEYIGPTYTNFKEYFKYECPAGKVLRGEESLHMHSPDDRKFRYQCCSMEVDI